MMGKEAASYAPESGTYFKDPAETAQQIVDKIKENEKADLIICLSHGGTSDNPDDSEDEILAENVEGIDMILSAHSHTVLDEPIVIDDTVVVSAGQYNRNLGIVSFEKQNGEYVLREYSLKPLDESVGKDAAIETETEKFKALVDRHYFGKYRNRRKKYGGVFLHHDADSASEYVCGGLCKKHRNFPRRTCGLGAGSGAWHYKERKSDRRRRDFSAGAFRMGNADL